MKVEHWSLAAANIRSIPELAATIDLPVGLSGHTLGYTVAAASVDLGAGVIDKHCTLS